MKLSIKCIQWTAAHRDDYSALLMSIQIGEYVFSLPAPDYGEKEIVFPLMPQGAFQLWKDPPDKSLTFPKIRFRRKVFTNGEDTIEVWMRVQ